MKDNLTRPAMRFAMRSAMRHALFATAVVAASSVACGMDGLLSPPPGFAYAAASAACAPTDGPAVTIYLSSSAISSPNPLPPNVQLSVWQPAQQLAGTWSLVASRAEGQAVQIGPSGGFVESAVSGSVSVLSVRADLTVIGNVDVTFASGTRIKGGFTAPWIMREVLCG